jgi:N-acetylmuramic acid 6-phosphate etherase
MNLKSRSKRLPDRSQLLTERRLAASKNLDRMSIARALRIMNQQDLAAAKAVAGQRRNVAKAVEMAAAALGRGGRIVYVGAGTSGRLGVLDAAECPPTFSSDPKKILGIIAGGRGAMFRSREGAEDRAADGAAAMDRKKISRSDLVIGIAAGGTTAFVHGAIKRAKSRGAKTVFICCVKRRKGEPPADLIIRPLVGPEILTGSTRLKAGTATKLILNQISTLTMVRLGKVYENLMIDLRATNNKLRDRAARLVVEIAQVPRQKALKLLTGAGGDVKTAIVMQLHRTTPGKAREILKRSGGNLRWAIQRTSTSGSSRGTIG